MLQTIKGEPAIRQRKFLKYTDEVFYDLFSLLKKGAHAGNTLKPNNYRRDAHTFLQV